MDLLGGCSTADDLSNLQRVLDSHRMIWSLARRRSWTILTMFFRNDSGLPANDLERYLVLPPTAKAPGSRDFIFPPRIFLSGCVRGALSKLLRFC